MNVFRLREQEKRGSEIEALLKNQHLVAAFEELEAELTKSWAATRPDESQRREDAWRSLKLLKKLQQGLEKHVVTGKTAGKQLLEIQNPSKLRKVFHV